MRLIKTLLVLAVAGISRAEAQWISQDIILQPGWNAIYLPFQPAPAECERFFAGLPVASVSWWCRSVGDAEYQSDPDDPFPRSAHWCKWVPGDPHATSFGALLAGESYLVNLATNVSMRFAARGTPVIVPAGWMHGEYNLVGFPVPANVTFGSFFAFTDRIRTEAIQQVTGDGSTAPVLRPPLAIIVPGRAYWVPCGPLATDFAGPVRLELGTSAKRMDFGGRWQPQTLRIINDTAAARSITLRHLASESPPAGLGAKPLAGKVPLLMEVADWSPDSVGSLYVPLPDLLITNVAANAALTLKLMPAIASLTGGAAGSAWQSVLRVSDEGNVQNEGGATVCPQVGVTCDTPDAAALDPSGLWFGSVSVTGVSRAPTLAGGSNAWDATAPAAVTRPYTFRVLLHRASPPTSQWHLLQSAYLATDTQGVDRVFTEAASASAFAASHPDCPVTRLSTVNLPLIEPLAMVSDGSNLAVTVTLAHDDPVNPFIHPFHPQHDGKEYRNGLSKELPAGLESYTVTRAMTFTFAGADPTRPGNPAWNISEAGGTFREAVSGLNKTIHASGPFRLERVSRAGGLTIPD